MRRTQSWSLVMAILVTGCSVAVTSSPSERVSLPGLPQSLSAGPLGSAMEREPLPSGFPVLAGAVAVAMPADDPGLIGLWESDEVGSAAYDFYVDALPTVGYPILGLYPGGDLALIRFQAPDGGVWQVISYASTDGGTTIEIRLDRP